MFFITMYKNAQFLEDKYHLPGFAYGVDGVLIYFKDKPQTFQPIEFNKSFSAGSGLMVIMHSMKVVQTG